MNSEERRFTRDRWRKKHEQRREMYKHYWEKHHNHRLGKIVGGLIFITIGALFLAREMGTAIPEWIFSWEMVLIAVGIYVGAKHNFRHPMWIILILVGTGFLIDDFYPQINLSRYAWPVVFIAIGLIVIFKPRRRFDHWWDKWDHHNHSGTDRTSAEQNSQTTESTSYFGNTGSTEDRLEVTCIFSGVKKNIISKDFKGGEVTCVMGGAEINLMNADIHGHVILEVTQIMGGTTLIIPPHWEVRSHAEMVAILGNIEDKRPMQQNPVSNPEKVLVIKGTILMGGLDIKSY